MTNLFDNQVLQSISTADTVLKSVASLLLQELSTQRIWADDAQSIVHSYRAIAIIREYLVEVEQNIQQSQCALETMLNRERTILDQYLEDPEISHTAGRISLIKETLPFY